MPEMTVAAVYVHTDKVRLYPRDDKYHVIASFADGLNVELGDVIEYEDGGVNFGWFKKNLNPEKQLRDLERTVIAAAISYATEFFPRGAGDGLEGASKEFLLAVDVLIAAREKQ